MSSDSSSYDDSSSEEEASLPSENRPQTHYLQPVSKSLSTGNALAPSKPEKTVAPPPSKSALKRPRADSDSDSDSEDDDEDEDESTSDSDDHDDGTKEELARKNTKNTVERPKEQIAQKKASDLDTKEELARKNTKNTVERPKEQIAQKKASDLDSKEKHPRKKEKYTGERPKEQISPKEASDSDTEEELPRTRVKDTGERRKKQVPQNKASDSDTSEDESSSDEDDKKHEEIKKEKKTAESTEESDSDEEEDGEDGYKEEPPQKKKEEAGSNLKKSTVNDYKKEKKADSPSLAVSQPKSNEESSSDEDQQEGEHNKKKAGQKKKEEQIPKLKKTATKEQKSEPTGTARSRRSEREKKPVSSEDVSNSLAKSSAFPHMWSEHDEMVMMRGYLDICRGGLQGALNKKEFLDAVVGELDFSDVTQRQLTTKMRRMKGRFQSIQKKIAEGNMTEDDVVFKNAHEREIFKLWKEAWGSDSNNDESEEPRPKQAATPKREPATSDRERKKAKFSGNANGNLENTGYAVKEDGKSSLDKKNNKNAVKEDGKSSLQVKNDNKAAEDYGFRAEFLNFCERALKNLSCIGVAVRGTGNLGPFGSIYPYRVLPPLDREAINSLEEEWREVQQLELQLFKRKNLLIERECNLYLEKM
eukprot:TRINITY_DN4642_c0_g2_i1.p1 TRINITY_DN4642_c0_g2~~TRINITY_DN4642_c0_g2_i1.p1  ORF type:complete len:646 (-),score=153.24 TRINITY_DN4642_c0_g2_i1:225-2162(-)